MRVIFFVIAVCQFLNLVSGIEFSTYLKIASMAAEVLYPVDPVPSLPQDLCWGANNCSDTDDSIRNFTVKFSNEMISDLRSRIKNRKNFTKTLNGTANTYGTNSGFLNTFLDYWATQYNFTERETVLNQFPQYKTRVQGLDIRFIHIKPTTTKKVIPLLMLHGWPYTAFEYIHTVKYLKNNTLDKDFEFEMIIPDLPGFGYSEATNIKGLSPYQIGIMFKNLMKRLGYAQFYVHAGDVGQLVGAAMAVMYPNDILGLHSNFAFSLMPKTLAKYFVGAWNTSAVVNATYEARMYPLSTFGIFYTEFMGYMHIHATRPDMLSKGLQDSPSGLASWIVCLLMTAKQNGSANLEVDDGRIWTGYDVNDLLDLLTIYWDQQNIGPSMRLYAEFYAVYEDPVNAIINYSSTTVPFAALKFLYEIIYQPDEFIKDKFPNLIYSNTLDYGGHSAGFENPEVLANNIWVSIDKMIEYNDDLLSSK